MSDGLSDCARLAESRANSFVKGNFPKAKIIYSARDVMKHGRFFLIYERWLDHIVEKIVDCNVKERWSVPPYGEITKLEITNENWSPGSIRQ